MRESKRRWFRWAAIGIVALVAVATLTSVWILNRSSVPRFSVLDGRAPSERYEYQMLGRMGNVGENVTYVFEANYDDIIQLARAELVRNSGWKETAPSHSKLFAEFDPAGPGSGIRIIRGNRTLPVSFRRKIPEKERHKWVVITYNREYSAFEALLSEMWRKIQ